MKAKHIICGILLAAILLGVLLCVTRCGDNSTDQSVPVDGPGITTPSEYQQLQTTDEETVQTGPVETEMETELIPETSQNQKPEAQETIPTETEPSYTEPPKETAPPVTEEPTATEPKPTEPKPTEPRPTEPTPTEPKPTEPAPTDPPETEPIPTDPPAAETTPTEPEGCAHEWICVHHEAEGHWRAGITCDCGWTVYGDPSELVSMWNTHSASYPPAESLFDHGGYGCTDEWIVDKPAYDEWVCSPCGEPKP